MNKVYISGKLVDEPRLRMDGDSQHLILKLRVAHRKRTGEHRSEDYQVNAWNRIAQWGASNLERGQVVALRGYLTQNASNNHATEVTAEEFFPVCTPSLEQRTDEEHVEDMSSDAEVQVAISEEMAM